MLKSKEYLSNIAEKCIKKAKTLGATDVEIGISNSIADTINYRNKEKEQSDRSEILSLNLITYIDKKKTNVSLRSLTTADYYDDETKELVANREKLIINKYNYKFPI